MMGNYSRRWDWGPLAALVGAVAVILVAMVRGCGR